MFKYTDIPKLIKEAAAPPTPVMQVPVDYSKMDQLKDPKAWYRTIHPGAYMGGLGLLGASAVIPAAVPGESLGSMALRGGITNGAIPVGLAALYAGNKTYRGKQLTDTASENQLRAAQNAADNNARWMQKRYNQWRISQGMEPIDFVDPMDWRNNPEDPMARKNKETQANIDYAINHLSNPFLDPRRPDYLKPVMTKDDIRNVQKGKPGVYVDSTVYKNPTDPASVYSGTVTPDRKSNLS